jgi:opacity protein-like surface antigen
MKKLFLLFAVFLFLSHHPVHGQAAEVETLEEYATPSVRGMGRSRGVIIGYERLPGFDIESESDNPKIGNGVGRVRRHNKFYTRAFAPVVNKPQTKVIVGIDYKLEEFNFDKISPNSYSLYQYLEDKDLKSVGLQVAYLHSLNVRNFYLLRVKGELNGDYTRDNISIPDYLKVNLDLAYGWKRSPDFALGIGLQLGYTYGRQSIYPGILYNRTFNNNWGVESIFPANARVRYNVNDKTLIYGGYRLEGASYDIFANSTSLQEFGEIELRRTDLKGLLRLEREIYDFLWFGIEGGFRQYYRHRVFEEVGSRDPLITNDLSGASYFNVEVYLVPPRRFTERNRNR